MGRWVGGWVRDICSVREGAALGERAAGRPGARAFLRLACTGLPKTPRPHRHTHNHQAHNPGQAGPTVSRTRMCSHSHNTTTATINNTLHTELAHPHTRRATTWRSWSSPGTASAPTRCSSSETEGGGPAPVRWPTARLRPTRGGFSAREAARSATKGIERPRGIQQHYRGR